MINKVTLIGNAGKDGEVSILPNGTTVLKFSMATTESYMDANGDWQNKTEWHNIIVFDKFAEKAKIVKGSLIYLEGKISNSEYEDQGGVKHRSYSIVAKTIRTLKDAVSKDGTVSKEDAPL